MSVASPYQRSARPVVDIVHYRPSVGNKIAAWLHNIDVEARFEADLRPVRTRSIRQPDLVIAGGPDSLAVLNAYMTRTWPRPVIVHVEDGAVGAAVEAKRLGAVNVFLGDLSRDDVVRKTLDALGFGEPLLQGTLAHAPLSPANALTAVEQKVICLIAYGQTNFEAAQALRVSPRTVQVHRYRAINKLAVRQRAAEAETRSRPPGA